MEMEGVEKFIEGIEKLTDIFGYWPSSRNAEVYELHLWRGDVEPESNRYVFPVLPSKIHVWELTNEVDREGFLVLRYHTLRSLRFHDVSNLKLDGFNYQNAIAELSIAVQTPPQGAPNLFAVHFAPAFGMACSFQCFRPEVVDAVPCSPDGKVPP